MEPIPVAAASSSTWRDDLAVVRTDGRMTTHPDIGHIAVEAEPFDWPPTMPNLLRRAVERFADHDLVVTSDNVRMTYKEIGDRSRFLARRLLASGIGKGSRVAILFPQGPSWLVAYFALGRIGAVTVAISTFAKPPELHNVLIHSDAHALLVASRINDQESGELLEQAIPGLALASGERVLVPSVPFLRSVWVEEERTLGQRDQLVEDVSRVAPEEVLDQAESEVCPSDPLVIIYTSGTTAEPKGVIHTHGALVRHGEALRKLGAIVEGDRALAAMPLFWVGGLSRTLGPTLHAGATLLTQPRFDPDGALDLMERERGTVIVAWETVVKRLIEHPRYAKADLSSLRLDPRIRRGGLGMTETCGQHTWRRPGEDPASVGSAVPGVLHRVVEPGTGFPVAPGVKGEICVRGYSVCVGLVKKERQEVFDGEGWYHTGDRGWIAENGLIYFDGRLTDMIKADGNNVAPAEIESTLLMHPDVTFALAFGLPHDQRGEQPVAIVVARAECQAEALRTWMKPRLASYKIPTRILVLHDQGDLPLLASGKPDRIQLTAMLGERMMSEGAG